MATDVGFVMDASGNAGAHWKAEKTFVKKLAHEINLSPAWGHASVTISSNNSDEHPAAELMIKFSDTTTLSTFEARINELPYYKSGADIEGVLEVALNDMFQKSNGMRLATPKTLVLITDGQQPGVNYPAFGKLFRDANIRVIVIVVGNVNTNDIRNLVDNDSDLHLAKEFDVLTYDSFIKGITLFDRTL